MKELSTEGGGAGILFTSCLLGSVGGAGVGGDVMTFLGVVGVGLGTGVVMMGLGVTGGFGGVTWIAGTSMTGGTSGVSLGTCGTAGIFGGPTGSLELMKILGGGKVIGIVAPGGITMSVPLQPSGKKYLMFSLRC